MAIDRKGRVRWRQPQPTNPKEIQMIMAVTFWGMIFGLYFGYFLCS